MMSAILDQQYDRLTDLFLQKYISSIALKWIVHDRGHYQNREDGYCMCVGCGTWFWLTPGLIYSRRYLQLVFLRNKWIPEDTSLHSIYKCTYGLVWLALSVLNETAYHISNNTGSFNNTGFNIDKVISIMIMIQANC